VHLLGAGSLRFYVSEVLDEFVAEEGEIAEGVQPLKEPASEDSLEARQSVATFGEAMRGCCVRAIRWRHGRPER